MNIGHSEMEKISLNYISTKSRINANFARNANILKVSSLVILDFLLTPSLLDRCVLNNSCL